MASITYPNTFTNGTIADATQVNANFDAITAQVNGNLDTTNIKDAAITLAKLASGVGTIEAIHYESNDSSVTYGTTLTQILSHTITLSSARYCLILAKGTIADSVGMAYINDGDSTTLDTAWLVASAFMYSPVSLLYYGQLSSGSHTIKLSCISNAGENKSFYHSKLVIVQFGF